jgi:hypothetical protein
VNASAPVLNREVDVQSKVRNVTNFGRVARVVCAALFGFGLVASVGMLIFGILRVLIPAVKDFSAFTPEPWVWLLPLGGVVISIWLAVVYQLYRLFGNLGAGSIYTSENVLRVRRVGLLWLLLAVIGVVAPIAAAVMISMGFPVPKSALAFSVPESLSSFAAAGLILLISWVLDVGLYEKDHADALQRDADLVI